VHPSEDGVRDTPSPFELISGMIQEIPKCNLRFPRNHTSAPMHQAIGESGSATFRRAHKVDTLRWYRIPRNQLPNQGQHDISDSAVPGDTQQIAAVRSKVILQVDHGCVQLCPKVLV
ncbi:hypothetical protein OXX69_013882, partial [Metschnikowia pulcherrima]